VDLQNVTRNQHFVSQAEQRLNATNPQARDENKRIYSFGLLDRESYRLSLDNKNGCKIKGALSLTDVFSFDIVDRDSGRYNFEKLFHRYESDIKANTESLISKLAVNQAEIKSEILNIFISKFINFVRNPYSIKKVLNTFPMLKDLKPTEPIHSKNFERVLSGRKPHQEHLCRELDITDEDYRNWLATIFLLLTPFDEGQQVFLEHVIKDMYENPETFISVMIYTYTDKTCLLSDRGYSIPLPEGDHMAWDFNLYSNGFIRYVFGSLESLTPTKTPRKIVEAYKAMPKQIYVHKIANDLGALEQYNKNVVYQCHKNVFSSDLECYGI